MLQGPERSPVWQQRIGCSATGRLPVSSESGRMAEVLACCVQIAERTILDDLEYLISQTITSPSQADYAVISGVQVCALSVLALPQMDCGNQGAFPGFSCMWSEQRMMH